MHNLLVEKKFKKNINIKLLFHKTFLQKKLCETEIIIINILINSCVINNCFGLKFIYIKMFNENYQGKINF